ncbi:TPA: hypothetical protein N0F65_007157 [Lagenidium giganteum]|uniref:GIY-YIG homing endonuclease n=1 Tax=Lagenidium giganteum TaxID=4803 RepID=A0AAV2YWG9_9STRA|nr:TPA: hypothetical protein N0F65_007157 [Lagenidium giganteum]
MVKIKQYEVADRSQLLAYETLWMSKFKKTRVNKVPAFSPMKIQRRKEAQKKYWEANKEAMIEKNKTYNATNKDRLIEQFQCDCGGKYQRRGKTYHFKTKKHIQWALSH